MAENREDKKSR